MSTLNCKVLSNKPAGNNVVQSKKFRFLEQKTEARPEKTSAKEKKKTTQAPHIN